MGIHVCMQMLHYDSGEKSLPDEAEELSWRAKLSLRDDTIESVGDINT